VGEPTDEEMQAWVDYWKEQSRLYHERLDRTLAVYKLAEANPGCDVCAHVREIKPRDVPEFLDALDRAGPLLGERVAVGEVWSFPTADVAAHHAGHTRS
jgi:hypothetical protein